MAERTKVKRLGPVEILVVVFVFLLLIAVIIGGSRKSRVDARQVECQKNLSVIANAMQLYANDYDGVFPRSGGKVSMWNTRIYDWKADNRFRAFGTTRNGEGGIATISSCFYLLIKYAVGGILWLWIFWYSYEEHFARHVAGERFKARYANLLWISGGSLVLAVVGVMMS